MVVCPSSTTIVMTVRYLRRWWRVRRIIFLCFFFRIRLRRFLMSEPTTADATGIVRKTALGANCVVRRIARPLPLGRRDTRWPVVQLAERRTLAPDVAGSSPAGPASQTPDTATGTVHPGWSLVTELSVCPTRVLAVSISCRGQDRDAGLFGLVGSGSALRSRAVRC